MMMMMMMMMMPGRAGKTGISHTFFTDENKSLAGQLVNVLNQAQQPVPEAIKVYPLFTKKKAHDLYGAFGPDESLAGTKSTKMTFDE
jgi:ATP-dependent RNA helicase DBP3